MLLHSLPVEPPSNFGSFDLKPKQFGVIWNQFDLAQKVNYLETNLEKSSPGPSHRALTLWGVRAQ